MPLANSAEQPLPVRTVARSISEWVAKLGRVWVEGQVTQLSKRPGTVFLTLRDPVADVSLTVTCARGVADAVVPPLVEGTRATSCSRKASVTEASRWRLMVVIPFRG